MPQKKYLVTLSDEKREQLEQLLHSEDTRDPQSDTRPYSPQSGRGLAGGRHRYRPRCGACHSRTHSPALCRRGAGAWEERPRPGTQPKLDAKVEAHLIAEACRDAPEGRKRWTLYLLTERGVACGLAESSSDESVRRVLKKATSSRG
jgi:hypothetical protein